MTSFQSGDRPALLTKLSAKETSVIFAFPPGSMISALIPLAVVTMTVTSTAVTSIPVPTTVSTNRAVTR